MYINTFSKTTFCQGLYFVVVVLHVDLKCRFLLLHSNLNTESILLHKTFKFYKNVTKINMNALSELNPSGSDLILTSYFSLLAHFGYML